MGFFNFLSELSEGMRHETEINFFALKFIRDFANQYNIKEIQYEGCNSWEEYDQKLLNIINLDMSNKGIRFVDREIKDTANSLSVFLKDSNVEVLSLSGNNIEKIPKGLRLADIDSLRELDLSNNNISEIPDDFELPHRLKQLDLSGNNLDSLPFDYRFHSNLEILNLSRNKFKSFRYGYAGDVSDKVKYLDLSNNHLRFFIASGCENLRTLKINKNEINHKLTHELQQVLERENSSFEENPICSAPDPYEEENLSSSNTYVNHCFKCSTVIDSRKNEQCDDCNFYKCGSCGSCFCVR